MFKSQSDSEFPIEPLKRQSIHQRFHPYYYQGRKGTLFNFGKRIGIKITKIEKRDDYLVLTLSERKSDEKINLQSFWNQIEFDYYSIRSSEGWVIKFSKK
jgi:hypothetical protein